jgi:Transposase DDE domain
METPPEKEGLTILRRLIAYSEKVFQLSKMVIDCVVDRRLKPRIPTSAIVKSVAALFWARMGSLNALELTAHSNFFRVWLGQSVCSADSVGRVNALMDADSLRRGIHHVYVRLKRNKALPDNHGIAIAALDGHESHASYLRHCPGCLERTIHTDHTDRTQFYHRQVTLMLLPGARPGCEPIRLLLDHEPQRAGEDEVATALRLLERVIGSYPRAFDLLLADALYGTAPFFNFLLAHGKHALVVLKDERRNLYQDAAGLFAYVPPQEGSFRSRQCSWWDFPDLLSWPQVNAPVRVIRSLETFSVRRQLDGKDDLKTSDWIWVTTLPVHLVSTERAVGFGHQRWDIENHGFNELVNGWHADHIYKHDPNAIECFLLIAFLAFNIFHALFVLNLKPQIRKGRTQVFWSRFMAAEIYAGINPTISP